MSTAETKKRDPFEMARKAGRREASGFVARDNVDSVFAWVLDLLFDENGDPRRYTWVDVYEYSGWRPSVHTGQIAREAVRAGPADRPTVMVSDSSRVWSLAGGIPTQPRTLKEEVDALGPSMHLTISNEHLRVRLRTPEGKLAWWHLQLEREG